jgi:hypothetical protein
MERDERREKEKGGERKRVLSFSFFSKIYFFGTKLVTSFNLKYFFKALSPIWSHQELELQLMNF